MSLKAIDRYSKDYVELQTKDNVKFYKTPDAVLKAQLEIYDEWSPRRSRRRIRCSRKSSSRRSSFAERATRWEQDTVVNRRMAFDHYFGANGAAKKI